MKLFSMDGKFLETFNKITDLVTLNILWLLCCIPIITIGASTSALYQVTLQIAENRDSYITKEFFKAFRENFRQATIVWLAVIVTGFVLLSDMFIISHFFTGSDMSVILGLIFMILILLFAGSMYFFPVIAYFRNSTKKIFSNSFRLAFSNLRTTLPAVFNWPDSCTCDDSFSRKNNYRNIPAYCNCSCLISFLQERTTLKAV